MTITVNGQLREIPEGVRSVADLLAWLGAPSTGVAVALDRAVVPRSAHAATLVHRGANVEVIRAVGGG